MTDSAAITDLLKAAGFGQVETSITQLLLPLPALADWAPRHISATPMAASFNQAPAAVQQRVIDEVIAEMGAYMRNDQVVVPFQSHMILGRI